MTESPELRPAGSSPGAVPRPWLHTVVTGGLLILWCGVIIFAIITWINPPWLAEMSRPGRKTEADWYSAAGVTRLRNNDFAGAISAFKQALAVNEDTQTRVHLAIAVARSGQVDAGVRLLEQALQENPGKFLRGVILFNIAEMIWRNPNNYEVAKRLYQEALECGAEPDKVYRRLGVILLSQNKPQEALVAFEKTRQAQLDLTQPYRNMLQRAMEGLSVVSTEELEAQAAAGITEEELRARYDVQTLLAVQQEDNPEMSETHKMLGNVHAMLGDFARAQQEFQEALRLWPGNQEAAINLERVTAVIQQLADVKAADGQPDPHP